MTQSNQSKVRTAENGANLFADCDGLLAELSTSDEAVLTGGGGYKGYGRGGSSSSGGGFKKGGFGSSSSGRGGFKKYSYGYSYFKPYSY